MTPGESLVHGLVAAALLGLAAASPAFAGDAQAGRTKARTCIPCHGANGIATNPGAPHLAAQPHVYLAEQLRNFRSGKRTDPVMTVIAKPLTDDDIDDLASWYSSVSIEAKTP
ncbi:MAG: cytochrome c [Burkholderiaceae bacterium]|nr:cytochrome c [Burkholderiaceae bacterium]